MRELTAIIGGQRDPGWVYLAVLGGLAVIVFLLQLLNKVLIHFFPSLKTTRVAAGNALMRVEATFLPGREHILEARERDDVEEDDQGEPPITGIERDE